MIPSVVALNPVQFSSVLWCCSVSTECLSPCPWWHIEEQLWQIIFELTAFKTQPVTRYSILQFDYNRLFWNCPFWQFILIGAATIVLLFCYSFCNRNTNRIRFVSRWILIRNKNVGISLNSHVWIVDRDLYWLTVIRRIV
jgi:hypothetical protein